MRIPRYLAIGVSSLALMAHPAFAVPVSEPAFPEAQWANAIDYGADPTGNAATDSSVAINAALAQTFSGRVRNAKLPAGDYHITHSITIGNATQSQCLEGDGWGTILHIGADFDPTASAVVTFAGGNPSGVQPCLHHVHFVFDQPADFVTTATASSAAGTSTVTVADASGLAVGDLVNDASHTSVIPEPNNNGQYTLTKVQSISGNAVTLTSNFVGAGITSGDTITFASPRSSMKTLAQGCTVTVKGTGCKYPWAVNSGTTGQSQDVDDVFIEGAWDGVFLRGSTFHIGKLYVGALDIGLDFDNCFNFPQIDDVEFWNFGFNQDATKHQNAFIENYYDGTTIAANMGRTDGISIKSLQTWAGIVNVTTTWTFGAIDYLMLDGNNANLNVNATSGSGFLLVANLYSTKGSQSNGTPMQVAAGSTNFDFSVGNLNISSAIGYANPTIRLSGGTFNAKGGYTWNGMQGGAAPFILQTGGELKLAQMRLDASSNRNNTYIQQSGGDLQLGAGIAFPTVAGASGVGLSVASDNALNLVSEDISWNGWANPLYPRVSLTTAGYTVPAVARTVRLTQASTLASATMTLPTAVRDGQVERFSNGAGAVTALSFSPAVNGWTNGSTLAAYTSIRIRWDAAAASWQRE